MRCGRSGRTSVFRYPSRRCGQAAPHVALGAIYDKLLCVERTICRLGHLGGAQYTDSKQGCLFIFQSDLAF